MKTIPLQQRYAIGLVALGYTEIKPTRRFRIFARDQSFKDHILKQDGVPTHTHYGQTLTSLGMDDLDFSQA